MASRYRALRRRRRHEDSSNVGLFVAVGALAGIAAGVLLAQRYGGLSALSEKVSRGVRDRIGERFGERFADRFGDGERREREAAGFRDRGIEGQDYDDEPLDDEYADEGEELEERVLEAFRNDPILSERAIDIGAIGRGIIELTGWVHAEDETQHAVTVTRGVPGVDTVVNRLVVRDEEERMDDSARRYESGEAETSPRWEGQGVGTGRPRQGTSADPGRHSDPRAVLEDRWQGKDKAIRAAAEDIDGLAERRDRAESTPGDRTGGAPVAPSGVPKGDHVADPASAEPILREQTGRVTRAD
ncbi:transport-associated protein [Gemmatirosa kalamazoonensis]|uniref:Transport-associated protein n=1 Tax=Gemmatirosa kalamazoonensis TaxID=861299 RepID=W0RM67_9BACT|nr:BON domain-containing protein [Gemmatirosa kalamazoonensis]AHG90533.1 transport-associated protein [Gemmatirosa kalamazoonensis]